MDAKLTKIYYSPKGYWKGMAAIKKLANAAKVSEDVAKRWLTKQALWQVYLPGPHYIPRPKFDVSTPNTVHQADLLFLPHDKLPRGKKVYKYALTVVDVASRYKAAEALTSKESDEVFARICQDIQTRAAEVAANAASRSGTRAHGRCYQGYGRTQCYHSPRATQYSQRSSYS